VTGLLARVDLSLVIGRDWYVCEIGDSSGSRGSEEAKRRFWYLLKCALGPGAERKSPWWSVGDGRWVFREQEASVVSVGRAIEALDA